MTHTHGPAHGHGHADGVHDHDHPPDVAEVDPQLFGHVRAVLLDMDGTIVDSDAAVDRAWVTWAEEFGVPADRLHAPPGQPALPTVRQMRPDLDDAAAQVAALRQMALQYDDLDDVVALPGALALLTTLDRLGMPWAVVTSADRPLAKARLGAAGLEVPVLVTIEDVERGKPFPDCFLAGAAALCVAPEQCLVVEDAVLGVQAGRAAGMRVAGLKGAGGDVALRHLHELVALLFASRP